MIELFASDSAAAARRQGLLRAGEESVEEVLSLALDLDVGEIAGLGRDTNARLPVMESLYGHFPGVPEIIARLSREAMEKLLSAAEAGKAIRCWVCEADPSEMCTLYFLCHLLEGTPAEIRVVRVAKEIVKGRKVVRYRSTGRSRARTLRFSSARRRRSRRSSGRCTPRCGRSLQTKTRRFARASTGAL